MLTVAQMVELQIVVLVVVSSILICQPKKGNMIVNILKFWMVLVVLAHIVLLLQAIN